MLKISCFWHLNRWNKNSLSSLVMYGSLELEDFLEVAGERRLCQNSNNAGIQRIG